VRKALLVTIHSRVCAIAWAESVFRPLPWGRMAARTGLVPCTKPVDSCLV